MKKLFKSNKAFTLVEIMIVVGIIILLASLAIPNLLRAKMTANEAAAIKNLKTLQAVFESYRTMNPRYPYNFAELVNVQPSYLDNSWLDSEDESGEYSNPRNGYRFMIKPTSEPERFFLIAEPQEYGVTAKRMFFMDENGEIIDAESGGIVGAASPQ